MTGGRWRAYCTSCGWVCHESRRTEQAALDDGAGHEVEIAKGEPDADKHHSTKVSQGS